MNEAQYYKFLLALKKSAKDEKVSLARYVNDELKKYKKFSDREKDNDDFFKRITANAGPRD